MDTPNEETCNKQIKPILTGTVAGRHGGTLHPVKKGSGPHNPAGRPKGTKNFATLLKEAAEWKTPKDILKKIRKQYPHLPETTITGMAEVAVVHLAALRGEEWAYKRLHGLPTQSLDINSNVNTNQPVYKVVDPNTVGLVDKLLNPVQAGITIAEESDEASATE